MGVPVVTRIGQPFPRASPQASCKRSARRSWLRRTSRNYEALAIALATDAERLAALKRKLADNSAATPLFDVVLLAKPRSRLCGDP